VGDELLDGVLVAVAGTDDDVLVGVSDGPVTGPVTGLVVASVLGASVVAAGVCSGGAVVGTSADAELVINGAGA
jgi:hypothetical protein